MRKRNATLRRVQSHAGTVRSRAWHDKFTARAKVHEPTTRPEPLNFPAFLFSLLALGFRSRAALFGGWLLLLARLNFELHFAIAFWNVSPKYRWKCADFHLDNNYITVTRGLLLGILILSTGKKVDLLTSRRLIHQSQNGTIQFENHKVSRESLSATNQKRGSKK